MKIHPQRICAALAACLALAWLLPLQFQRITAAERFSISGAYSAIQKEFIIWEHGPDYLNFRREDGTRLDRREAAFLTPLLFSNDIRKWGGFPLRINGRTITAEEAAAYQRFLTLRPRLWNSAIIPLHTLLEAAPEGTCLALPPDVFRVCPDRLEFVRCTDGSLDEEKSRQFTAALKEAGLVFPVLGAGSNASPLKPFDMGVLLVDSNGRVFQMQMIHGKPAVRDTWLNVPGRLRAVLVDEHPARDFYGVIVTDNAVHLVAHGDRLLTLPLENFNADRSTVLLRFDCLNITLGQQSYPFGGNSPQILTATDRQGTVVRRQEACLPEHVQTRRQWTEACSALLFPVALQQFTPLQGGGGLTLRAWHPFLPHLLPAALGAAVWCLVLRFLRRRQGSPNLPEYALTAIFGLSGLISVLAFGPLHRPSGDNA